MKKINILIAFFFIFFLNNFCFSQCNEDSQHPSFLIFAEGGGPGIMSVNLEKYFSQEVGLRAGVGYGLFPIYLNYYIGKEKQLELGIGMIYSPYKIVEPFVEKEKSVLVGLTIGHKYQPIRGGLTLRFSFTPLFNPSNGKTLILGGISMGFAFK